MKTTIRRDTFETNSSSEHSVSYSSREENIKQLLNDIRYDIDYNFGTIDDVYKILGKLEMVKSLVKEKMEEEF